MQSQGMCYWVYGLLARGLVQTVMATEPGWRFTENL